MCRAATENQWNVDAADDSEVCTRTGPLRAEAQPTAVWRQNALPKRNGIAVDGRGEVCTGDGNGGVSFKLKFRPFQGKFEHCGLVWIPHKAIGDHRRKRVHRAGDGDSILLVTVSSQVLHRGQPSALDHYDAT